jgi:hypothetical protein
VTREQLKDHGHYFRKIVWMGFNLPFVPVGIANIASQWVLDRTDEVRDKLLVWSHPCLYRRIPKDSDDGT